MKKKIIALGEIALCCILMVVAVSLVFVTEGEDALKMDIIYICFALFMLHSCYRINKFRKAESKTSGVIETELKLHQVDSVYGFLRRYVFFQSS